jgi:protein TonB
MIDWRDPDSQPERRVSPLAAARWTTAVALVAAAHGAAAWVALNWKPAMAAGEPPQAVMIELAPLAVAPEAPQQDVAPGPQMTEAQTETAPEAVEQPVEKPDEKVPVPSEPQIEMPTLPEKEKAEAVLTPPPKPVKKPPRKVKRAERKKPITPDQHDIKQTTAPPTSQAQRANTAAAPWSSSSDSHSMSPASWRGTLIAHLNRHKRFPGGAASTGTASVSFTINRSGAVLSARLVRSSGDPALDAEAVALPRRASPVPAPPSNIGGSTVTLSVPIRFSR